MPACAERTALACVVGLVLAACGADDAGPATTIEYIGSRGHAIP